MVLVSLNGKPLFIYKTGYVLHDLLYENQWTGILASSNCVDSTSSNYDYRW